MHCEPTRKTVHWLDPTRGLRSTLVAHVSYTFADGEIAVPTDDDWAPLASSEPDRAPVKRYAELVVVGHTARRPGGALVGIGIARDGGVLLQKRAWLSEPGTDGSHPFGPNQNRAAPDGTGMPESPVHVAPDFDIRAFQWAPSDQWFDAILGGEQLSLRGFEGTGPAAFVRLPLFEVRVRLPGGGRSRLFADTLLVDTDRRRLRISYRRVIEVGDREEPLSHEEWTATLVPARSRTGYLRSPKSWSHLRRKLSERRPSPSVDPVEIINRTGSAAGTARWLANPEEQARVLIIKRTFTIQGERLVPIDEEPALSVDRFSDDGETAELMVASDYAPLKSQVDVLVRGTAHARPGEQHALVRLRAGDVDTSIVALPPRRWTTAGYPEVTGPFEPVALSWKYAFGGPSFPSNPVGTGRAGQGAPPRIEDPNRLLRDKADVVAPVGMGAISPRWQPRRALLGTFGGAWAATRWPAFPDDFQPAFFQAAPLKSRARSVSLGSRITLTSVRPQGEDIAFDLPARAPRLLAAVGDETCAEVPLRLDTVVIEADDLRVELVWRGRYPIALRPRAAERVLVLDADDKGRDDVSFAEAFDVAWEPVLTSPIDDRPLVAIEELPALDARLETTPEPTLPDPGAPRTVEDLRAAIASGARMSGRDFSFADLSHADLTGVDLAGIILCGANLEGARLDGANLRDADLSRVLAKGASLAGAHLDRADLTFAVLDDAELRDATAKRASFSHTTMCGANLENIEATGASFVSARLDDVTAERARLAKADLSYAAISRGRFAHADLRDAKLYECVADNAVFDDARLDHARFELARLRGASLERASAADSNWDRADLTGAAMQGIVLPSAVLGAAVLNDANLERASATGAIFIEAELRNARLDGASLRGADFEGADCEGARFEGADYDRRLPRSS